MKLQEDIQAVTTHVLLTVGIMHIKHIMALGIWNAVSIGLWNIKSRSCKAETKGNGSIPGKMVCT